MSRVLGYRKLYKETIMAGVMRKLISVLRSPPSYTEFQYKHVVHCRAAILGSIHMISIKYHLLAAIKNLLIQRSNLKSQKSDFDKKFQFDSSLFPTTEEKKKKRARRIDQFCHTLIFLFPTRA